MKKLALAIAFAVAVGSLEGPVFCQSGGTSSSSARPRRVTRLNVGADPQDLNRRIDWRVEDLIRLTERSPELEVKAGPGGVRRVRGYLFPGDLVVTRKVDGIAVWIAPCGNEVITPGWRPVGIMLSPEEAPGALLEEFRKLREELEELKLLVATSSSDEEILTEVRITREEILEILKKEERREAQPPTPAVAVVNAPLEEKPVRRSWLRRYWWVVPIVIGATAAASLSLGGRGGAPAAGGGPIRRPN